GGVYCLDVSGLWSALAFLTRLPVPRHEARLDAAVVWLPLIGLLLGGILAAADAVLRHLAFSELVIGAILTVLLLGLTGALHADGLMDTADAVFSHATPERRLEIMRDPRTGAFGVVSMVCIVLLKMTSIVALPVSIRPATLALAPTLGRWSIVLLAGLFPYGRQSGLGAPLKAGTTPLSLLLASIVPLGVCALSWPIGPPLAVIAVLLALGLGRLLLTALPGLTGDCYGAGCEVVETVVWLAAAPLAHALF